LHFSYHFQVCRPDCSFYTAIRFPPRSAIRHRPCFSLCDCFNLTILLPQNCAHFTPPVCLTPQMTLTFWSFMPLGGFLILYRSRPSRCTKKQKLLVIICAISIQEASVRDINLAQAKCSIQGVPTLASSSPGLSGI